MFQPRSVTARALRGALLAGAMLLLGGCVTEVGYQAPYDEVSSGGEIEQPPPPLPAYAQPPCPGDGYLWIPGYWAYSGGYYWVPGTWVVPPQPGFLWTPGYWGFAGAAYVWHEGYWGRHVGFYGGVRYGFGYDGDGYHGGRWEGRHFAYNRYVTNVDRGDVRYTYDERVDRRFDGDRVSYQGGRGGMVASPTREDLRYEHEEHVPATFAQRAHREQSAGNRAFFARENNGRPPVMATPRPGRFQVNGEPRPSFPSRPHGEEGATSPARADFQARPLHPSPGFRGHGPGVQHPQPRQGFAPPPAPRGRPQRSEQGGPQGRPQGRPQRSEHGRPAPDKDRRPHSHDR
jgi:WXXGXW repeat (2 copies)